MKLFEMEGFLRGKCIPRDLKVNETNAEYLVRKFAEADAMCAALAAENTGMKAKGRELLGEACAVYAKFNKLIDPEIGDFIDGQTLHEFQYVLDCETPATDAFLAEVRAQGVEMAACALDDVNQFNYANMLDDLAQKLRQGGAE
ncbi:hypothetical protein V8H53_003089 [Enterobacter hormaechei]|nr:hypothetical protein [Enterobacter hormaechei]